MIRNLKRTLIAFISLGCATSSDALAQAGPISPDHLKIARDRASYGKVVHVLGDSVMRGWALGRPPDVYTAEEAKEEVFWDVRSPAAMLNLIANGKYFAAYAGNAGQPDSEAVAAVGKTLNNWARGKLIRAGDVVVFEDAGNHPDDPDAYKTNYISLRKALCGSGALVFILNTYDQIAGPADGVVERGLRWSVPFNGKTFNEAIAEAVAERLPGCEPARLIDVYSAMRAATDRGIDVMQKDGIHPNLAGQWLIAKLIAVEIDTASRELPSDATR